MSTSLPEDLLSQSHHLVALDRKRPRQANLRRAISTSYYAVFHLLAAAATQRFIPKRPVGLTAVVQRSFSHHEMKRACSAITAKPLPEPLVSLLGRPASTPLRLVASYFIDLQEQRHKADYDVAASFSRPATLSMLAKADFIFSCWRAIGDSEEATVFLAALAFSARWTR